MRADPVHRILTIGVLPTFDEDRARLYVLNRTRPFTGQHWHERHAIQARLRAQGFYGPTREEREDSEGEAMIQRQLDGY